MSSEDLIKEDEVETAIALTQRKAKVEYVSTTVMLTKENDNWIRMQLRRKGDFSRIINEALDKVRVAVQPSVSG